MKEEKKVQKPRQRHIFNISQAKALAGESVLSYLHRHGHYLDTSCGGQGSCGKCFIRVLKGQVSEAVGSEIELLKGRSLDSDYRLACYLKIEDDLLVEFVDHELSTLSRKSQIVEAGPDKNETQSRAYSDKSTLEELVPWWKGAEEACYGLAMDIGTTTVVLYLLDLKSGETVAINSFLNPQRAFGTDVLSRIDYCNQNEGNLNKLQQMLVDSINKGIKELLRKNKSKKDQLARVVAVGNTTMLHLLLGASVVGLGAVPFRPMFLESQKLFAVDIGLYTHPQALLRTLPCISAFAGADLLAGMEGSGLFAAKVPNLLIDIGTNGEIALGCKQGFLTCSTAAGPAFEGGRIAWGVGSIAGAIDHVTIGKPIKLTTIGGLKPIGICGSGLVDIAAGLLNQNILMADGLLQENLSGQRFFQLEPISGIGISQQDVRELQLAKAAIYAGIECLQAAGNIRWQDIQQVWLAGGFGTYMNLEHALRIGLFPAELSHKIKLAGNVAGRGACQALLSEKRCTELEQIANSGIITYMDLAQSPTFQKKFLNAIDFPSI